MIRDDSNKCTATHRKTGLAATARHRSLARARSIAVAVVRSMVAGGVADGGGKVVRSYVLDGPWIKDGRTGKVFRGADVIDAVLDRGEIERVKA